MVTRANARAQLRRSQGAEIHVARSAERENGETVTDARPGPRLGGRRSSNCFANTCSVIPRVVPRICTSNCSIATTRRWAGRRCANRSRRISRADKTGPSMDILMYVPKQVSPAPVPAFVGLNFGGNQAVHADPGIRLSTSWMRDGAARRCRPSRHGGLARQRRRVAGRSR